MDLAVPCTYDFDVVASRYFDALPDGDVPLEFLFGGTLFYLAEDGRLQTGRIAWDREAEYRFPVAVWRATMDRYFPDTAWLRLRKDCLDDLHAYKSCHAFASWEDAVNALLGDRGTE